MYLIFSIKGTRDSVVSAKDSFNGDGEARYQAQLGVILFPEPYMGHLTLMLHLGNVLYSKGFSTTIIQTRFNSPDPAQVPNFTFLFIEDAISKSESPPSDPLEIFHALNASCLDPFRVTLSWVLEYASKGNKPVACLISDPLWEFAGAVADGFNLPRMALRMGGLFAFLVYDSVPLLREKGYFPLQGTSPISKTNWDLIDSW